MQVTPQGFGVMTARMKQFSEELCEGRLLLALEGGYHLDGIAQSIQHTLYALAGYTPQLYVGAEADASTSLDRVIADVHAQHAQTWPLFKA